SAALRLGGPAYPASLPQRRDVAERQDHRIGVPHLVLLPHTSGAVRVTLLRSEPFGEYRLGVDPAQEVAGGFLVLRIAHDHVGERIRQVELPARTLGDAGVQDVLP